MSLHVREQILASVQSALTGLATTGARVTRASVWPAEAPALNVMMGADAPADGVDGAVVSERIDRVLTVHVVAIAAAPDGALDTLLNAIEVEVYEALRAWSHAAVLDHWWAGTAEPERSDLYDQPSATMPINWSIYYRHAIGDVTAA